MARKAKLDILEIENDSPPEGEPLPPAPPGKRSASLLWLVKRYLPFIGAGVMLVIAAGLVFFLAGGTKQAQPDAAAPPQASPSASVSGQTCAELKDFYIGVKDAEGRLRILSCSLGIEVSPGLSPREVESRPDIRKTVYQILRRGDPLALQHPDGRMRYKGELVRELGRKLGAEAVRGVYFTDLKIL